MPAAPKDLFKPPTPEQFEEYLREHPASPLTAWQLRMPWVIFFVLFLLSYAVTGLLSALVMFAALFWLIGHTSYRTRRLMHLQGMVRRNQETAVLRRYPKALRQGWRALPRVASMPHLHGQTVAMMSHCLDTLGQYDAAIVGYDYLLNHMPPGQPAAVHIGVSRAAAALGAERLADADDALRRLRGPIEPYPDSTISAAYRLATLTQQVRTHHFAEGVQQGDGLIDALRPLGVDAGYGHALMALCHYHADDTPEPHEASDTARTWWQQATLLLPPGTLLKRFPELKPLTELA